MAAVVAQSPAHMASLIIASVILTTNKIREKREAKREEKRKAYEKRYKELQNEETKIAQKRSSMARRSQQEDQQQPPPTYQDAIERRRSSSEGRGSVHEEDGPDEWVNHVVRTNSSSDPSARAS